MPYTSVRGADIALPARGPTGDITPEARQARDQSLASAAAAEADRLASQDAANAAASAAGTVGNYDTLAQANAALSSIPANGGVNVLADGVNNGFYVKVGSALVRKSTATLTGVSATTERLSRAADVLPPSAEYAHILQDLTGFFQTYFRIDGAMRNVTGQQDILGLRVVQDDNDWLALTDELGFVLAMFSASGVVLPGFDPGQSSDPEPEPASITPYFSADLCGLAGSPINIFLSGLLANRRDAPLAQMAILGIDGLSASSTEQITLLPQQIGASGELIVRPRKWDGSTRAVRSLTVRTAPNPAVAPTQKNILLIADSIGNRQGAFLLNQYLSEAGYQPNFIGTMRGSASPTTASAATGPLGECREGWESGDYTNKVTNRSLPIEPGQEAAYLAMSKTLQRDYNPFIRAATDNDPASIVRNGYVLDFAFYQSRFNLAAPDVVIYALGTNDVRDLSSSIIGREIYENDLLLLARLRAAWPNVRIIRTVPGTARDAARDPIWNASYIPLIRGMMRAQNELADARMVLAPVWAMVSQDGGYSLLGGASDAVTGVVTTTLSDAVHPIDGNRNALYRALSGYVACAMAELF